MTSQTAARTGARYVLAGVDGLPRDAAVVEWAVAEAGYRHLPLHIIHVVEQLDLPAGDAELSSRVLANYAAHAEQVLAGARGLVARQRTRVQVDEAVRTGQIVPTLLAAAADAALVVLGSGQQADCEHVGLVPVVTHLATHAPCPVLVTRPPLPPEPFRPQIPDRVVVGVDGSPASQEAIGFAFEEASWRGLGLTAVHAWQGAAVDRVAGAGAAGRRRQAEHALAESLAGWREKYPQVPVTEKVVWDRPAHALLTASAGAALLVVGSHGRGHFAGMLLGSVSQTLLRYAPTSLAVARPHTMPSSP